MTTLQARQWFMYPIDSGIPNTVHVYEGKRGRAVRVQTLTKMQALALARWHGHGGLWFSYTDGNGRQRDVRVVGDVEAWMGDE